MLAWPRSLRFKLTVWFVIVFSIIQITLIGAIALVRGEAVQRSLDDSLAKSAELMIDNMLADEGELEPARLRSLVPAGAGFLLYAIRDEDGDVLASHGVPDLAALPFDDWESVPAGPVGNVITPLGPDRAEPLTGVALPLRLVTMPFRYEEELYFLQAAVRDQALERFLGPYTDLVVVGVPVGVVAAMLAAWLIAGRAVSPLRRLAGAVRGVSPTSLGERFHPPTSDEEVSRLADELNSALARLEAGFRAQEQFISNATHELKTPIAVLLTEAQVAALGGGDRDKAFAFIDHAQRELRRLGNLVESLLTLARADILRHWPFAEVAVNDVVLESVQRSVHEAERRRVRLIPSLVEPDDDEPAPAVTGDAWLLQIMIENLVRNGVIHSPRGGSVVVAARRDGASVTIEVRDEGSGVPSEYLDKVFDRFVQVPNRESREGSGLGLAIASSIARLHQGSIAVHNNPGAGCSFVVSLPLGSESEAEAVAARG